jgi:hypothetical protein
LTDKPLHNQSTTVWVTVTVAVPVPGLVHFRGMLRSFLLVLRVASVFSVLVWAGGRSARAQVGRSSHLTGVGVAADDAFDGQHRPALFVAAERGSTFGPLGGLVTADLGYRFGRHEAEARLAAEGLVSIAGLHVGLVETLGASTSTALSLGAVVYGLSIDSGWPITAGISLTGQIYLYHRDEHPDQLVAGVRILWDVVRHRGDTG